MYELALLFVAGIIIGFIIESIGIFWRDRER